ncbi:hypothetical protein N7465_001659 [Penicillium sp. CMV-2018d]|nr:hypothetical protein N7465_001659 [Penicillium sp. CMV-2018d]
MAPLTKSQKKNRKEKKRRARRAAEAAANAPPGSAEQLNRLCSMAQSAIAKVRNHPRTSLLSGLDDCVRLNIVSNVCVDQATEAAKQHAAATTAPGSGEATAAGGDLGGPDRGGGQGALQGATVEQAVAESLPGGSTDPAPASPAPSSPPTPPLTPHLTLAL